MEVTSTVGDTPNRIIRSGNCQLSAYLRRLLLVPRLSLFGVFLICGNLIHSMSEQTVLPANTVPGGINNPISVVPGAQNPFTEVPPIQNNSSIVVTPQPPIRTGLVTHGSIIQTGVRSHPISEMPQIQTGGSSGRKQSSFLLFRDRVVEMSRNDQYMMSFIAEGNKLLLGLLASAGIITAAFLSRKRS